MLAEKNAKTWVWASKTNERRSFTRYGERCLKDRVNGVESDARAESEHASALLQSSAQQAITPVMPRKFVCPAPTHPTGRRQLE